MSIKDKLKLYPWDKLSHYQWASWFATVGAVVAMLVGALWGGAGAPATAAIGASAAVLVAYAAGALGEYFDERANEAADAFDTPPHQVSRADVMASALGALPVAVPLLVLAALLT